MGAVLPGRKTVVPMAEQCNWSSSRSNVGTCFLNSSTGSREKQAHASPVFSCVADGRAVQRNVDREVRGAGRRRGERRRPRSRVPEQCYVSGQRCARRHPTDSSVKSAGPVPGGYDACELLPLFFTGEVSMTTQGPSKTKGGHG